MTLQIIFLFPYHRYLLHCKVSTALHLLLGFCQAQEKSVLFETTILSKWDQLLSIEKGNVHSIFTTWESSSLAKCILSIWWHGCVNYLGNLSELVISGLSVLHRSAAATLHIFLDEAKHNITFDPRTPAVIKEFLQLWKFKSLILWFYRSKIYLLIRFWKRF